MKRDWELFFNEIKDKTYFISLINKINKERSEYIIYPKVEDTFNAFKFTPLDKIKVVLIGQDPYINENQAMGLAFSVPKNTKLPPSLINIYKEIENEFNLNMDFNNGDLTYLAKQGVFLINPILTVRKGITLSHNYKEYKFLFIDILNELEKLDQPIVYLLLGNKAKEYKKYINTFNTKRLVLEASHPSPLGANKGGFFNSNIFIKTNEFLVNNNVLPINWKN